MFFDLHGPVLPDVPRPSIFTALIAPRPIGWVSSVSSHGVVNLAPFSYFNLLSSSPATVIFSCTAPTDRHEKDTLANVKATGEFVINLVSRELLVAMHKSSSPVPNGVNEFEFAGVDSAPSVHVKPPHVRAAPAALECRLLQLINIEPERLGDSHATAVLGRVVGLHIAAEFLNDQYRFDTISARLITRLGGNQYAEIGTITELPSLVHAPQ